MKLPIYPSLYGQLLYVIINGLLLLFIPNTVLGMFGFEPTHEIWLRVMGLLVLALSFYYYNIAHHGNRKIVMATVYGRLFFCGGLVLFAVFGIAQPMIAAFAGLETLLALWSWREAK